MPILLNKMTRKLVFISFTAIVLQSLLGNFQAAATVKYDRSFTSSLLATPWEPQYGGGIVVNPKLDKGSEGWTQIGNNEVEIRQANDGNKFVVATRGGNQAVAFPKFNLEKDKLYAFSVWVQSSSGDAHVRASFKIAGQYRVAGWVSAKEGGWSMLKGGFTANVSGPAEVFFDSDGTSKSDIWVDNMSLQPFTWEEWKSQQDWRTEMARKRYVAFQVKNDKGQPTSNATVSIKQIRPNFPFGCAMSKYILENKKYEEWFFKRFKYYTTFENEMKWAYIEKEAGKRDYTFPDKMMSLAKSRGLAVRGHTIHWGAKENLPPYLMNSASLSAGTLGPAAEAHTNSIVNKYKGQLIHWDVVNEIMHHKFFDEMLGEKGTTHQYKTVNQIDPSPLLFLNEYNTIEYSGDHSTTPWKYLDKISQLRKEGYNGPLGIGLQGHFTELNLPYIRSSLDIFETTNLTLWITELDVDDQTNGDTVRANYLEEIIRELHSHPAVDGIILWSPMWNAQGQCWRMCLTDANFVNLPQGDVVDKILAEWSHASGVKGPTCDDGSFKTSLFQGEYEAQVTFPGSQAQAKTVKFKVNKGRLPLIIDISSGARNEEL